MRQLTRCTAVVFVFLVLTAAPAGASTTRAPVRLAAAASIGVRIVDVPLAERNDPRAQLYFVDHLAPGTVVHRRIEVFNTSPSVARISLYSAAATISSATFRVAAGHIRNELSAWTSVRPSAPVVPANGHVTAIVSIAIPRDAAPGEQYGVVWAEARSPRDVDGITQVNRVGIRMYVSVGPGGAPASNFAIESLTAERAPNGRPTVLATVHNTGGRALDMSGTLQLSNGPGRLSAGPFPAALGVTLGIGETAPIAIALDRRLPAGPWDAHITLRSGLIDRSAEATITFPKAGVSAPVTATSKRQTGSPFSMAAVVTLAFAALLFVAPVVHRRLRTNGAGARPRPIANRIAGHWGGTHA